MPPKFKNSKKISLGAYLQMSVQTNVESKQVKENIKVLDVQLILDEAKKRGGCVMYADTDSVIYSYPTMEQIESPIVPNKNENNSPNSKCDDFILVDHSIKEEQKKEPEDDELPQMEKEIFKAKFKGRIQNLMLEIREYHHKQAEELEKQGIPNQSSYDIAQFKREKYASQLFYERYKFDKSMEGYDSEPMLDLLRFIMTERIISTKNMRFHSYPKNPNRFCQSEECCPLKEWVDWCDLRHVEDIQNGDILWTKCEDNYMDDPDITALVMVYRKNTFDDYSIFQLCKIKAPFWEENKYVKSMDFFEHYNHLLKNLDVTEYYHGNYKTSNYEIKSDQSKFICSLAELSYFYKTNFDFNQLSALVCIGWHEKNLLNYLLSGLLPINVLQSLKHIEGHIEISIENTITPEKMSNWIKEHGEKRVWQFLKALIIQDKYRDNIEHDKYFDYTLEELTLAIECFDYMCAEETYFAKKKPDNLPIDFILKKNIMWYNTYYHGGSCYRIYEIIIWCLKHGGDTSLITREETLESWKSKFPL